MKETVNKENKVSKVIIDAINFKSPPNCLAKIYEDGAVGIAAKIINIVNKKESNEKIFPIKNITNGITKSFKNR